jgi:hypothetical protein
MLQRRSLFLALCIIRKDEVILIEPCAKLLSTYCLVLVFVPWGWVEVENFSHRSAKVHKCMHTKSFIGS